MRWFEESLYRAVGQRLRIDRIVFEKQDGLQKLVIFENEIFGRVLALDGVVQTTTRDEFVYHEMLTHVPLLAHGSATRVLIIGGGDGGILREVLKHSDVERATMVEIDGDVVTTCREHLPTISAGAFDDPRTELVITDGMAYVAESRERFDVIIVDSTDPHGPGAVLFSAEFYRRCKERLTEGGIIVTQNGVPFFQGDELRTTMSRFRPLFRDVAAYVAAIPTYYGGFMAFGWGTDNPERRRLPPAEIAARFARANLSTRYYAPEIHQAAFALPRFIRDLMG